MYRKNKRSQQPLLISNVTALPARALHLLQSSWAQTFREEVFLRIREDRFAVLYETCPSRPNVPVNILMGLEILKAGYGWSDEELYQHYLFDLQVRYALGCDNFGEGDFDLRTLYYFRQRLSQYALASGINLVQLTFADITDQQLAKLEVKTGIQRMDSTDIASNIADLSRLELLITVVQRLHRMLSVEDQQRYQALLAPYIREGAGQYTYRIKGKAAVWAHIQQVGVVLDTLLEQLRASYGRQDMYAIAQRFFEENFKRVDAQVQAKSNAEIQSGCLQSVDDLEASYRVKGQHAFKGYVANLTETADPSNPVQLVTHLSVAPNRTTDQALLQQDVPAIQTRMQLHLLVNDGEYVGPRVDQVLRAGQVAQLTTALTGRFPVRADGKRVLADFDLQIDPQGQVTAARCPVGQAATVQRTGQGKGFRLDFAPASCRSCPCYLQQQCPIRVNQQQTRCWLIVPIQHIAAYQRRRRFEQTKEAARALRPAVEATMFQLKHKLRRGKVLVRGLLRVTNLVVCATLALNLRRIDRYRKNQQRGRWTKKLRKTALSSPLFFCFHTLARAFPTLFSPFRLIPVAK